MKKFLSVILTAALITGATVPVTAQSKITIKVNNQAINTQGAEPYIDKANRTLVPLRFVADNLQATTDWDSKTKTATVKQNTTTIEICIPCKKVKVDGAEIGTDSYGSLKDSRTYVPLRLIGETLGATVNYDSKNRVIAINTVQNPYNPNEYKEPDTSTMGKLDWSLVPKDKFQPDNNKISLYDGKGWNWNVSLIKEGVSEKGFGILYNESTAGALYLVTTNGEWIKARFPYPGGASFSGNHIGKEIDKVLFLGDKNYYYVDIDNFKVEK